MYTQEEWSQYEDMQDELNNIAEKYVREFGRGGGNESVTNAYIDGDLIIIEAEDYWAYGGHDTDSYAVPLSYLWTDNWLELAKEAIEKLRIEKEKIEHTKLIDANNKKLAEEQANYLELHKKYGGAK